MVHSRLHCDLDMSLETIFLIILEPIEAMHLKALFMGPMLIEEKKRTRENEEQSQKYCCEG
jgi:hypothetical protein